VPGAQGALGREDRSYFAEAGGFALFLVLFFLGLRLPKVPR
jgi:hypothetical protein